MIYYIFITIVGFLSLFLISRTRRLDYIFDPVVYFYLTHFIFFYLGLVYQEIFWDRELSFEGKIFPPLLILQFSFVVFSFDKILHIQKRTNNYYLEYFNNLVSKKNNSLILSSFIILVIGWMTSFIYFNISIGIEGLLSGDLDNMRIEGRKGIGWLALLSVSLIIVPSFYLYFIYLQRKKYLFTIIVFLISFVFLLLIGNRAPAFELLVIFIFIYYFIRFGRVNYFKLVIIGFILIFLLGLINIFRQADSPEIYLVIIKSLWRPYVNIDNFNLIINYFSTQPPLYGYGYLMDISVILPGYQPNFGTYFKDIAGLDFSGGGVTITYAGEIFANFGMFLFFIAPIYFMLIYVTSIIFNAHRMSLNLFVLMIITSISIKATVSSGIVSPILYIFIPFVIIFFLIHFLSQTLSKPTRK